MRGDGSELAVEVPPVSTRLDPLTGMAEGYLNGVFVGLYATEEDAMKQLTERNLRG